MVRVFVNGKICDDENLDFHGGSVFTTFRSHKDELCLWPLHWQRLRSHANYFEYQLPKERDVVHLLHEISKSEGDQKFRVIIFAHKYAIVSEPYSPPPSEIYEGVATIFSSINVHPQLAAYKTGNSLPYALAKKQAEKHAAFEALLSDVHGFIVDGSRTSLMMFDGKKITVFGGGLDGCMRAHVLSYVEELNIPVEKKLVGPNEIKEQQLMLLNSLLGVVPVASIRFPLVSHLVKRFRMD